MSRFLHFFTVLLALPLGAAAQTSEPEHMWGSGSDVSQQHQKHSVTGTESPNRAGNGSDAPDGPVKVYEFEITGGTLGDQELTIRVSEGETIEIRWSSDQELTLHMHGYNIEVHVPASSPVTMRIDAEKTGRFPILNHDSQPPSVLVYLEVVPK